MEHNNDSFEYNYSAKEQDEIRRIREKYRAPEARETKMERLRRLDAGVTKKAAAWCITLGVIFSLVMGGGMAMCMELMGVWFIPGIIIGSVGLVGVCMTYPLYLRIVQKERKRLAPEILALTEELMQ